MERNRTLDQVRYWSMWVGLPISVGSLGLGVTLAADGKAGGAIWFLVLGVLVGGDVAWNMRRRRTRR